jgi:DNA-binding response OmpR family regulator
VRARASLVSVASIPESEQTLYAGELEIRLGDGLVLASGRVVRLSVREFELLVAMARRTGAIATREELYTTVWGGELRHGDRSVDVYVSKLRGKPQPSREAATTALAGAASAHAEDGEHLSRDVHIGAPGT